MKLLFFLLPLSWSFAFGQVKIDTIKSWKTDAKGFAIDNLENVYLYNKNKLEKYNSNYQLFATYSNNKNGEIHQIDVTNPFKIHVWYKNQNAIEILDNTLSPEQNKVLDLTQANLYNTSAFAYSSIDNGIWFYDIELFQLIKINTSLERYYESGNLLQLLNIDSLEVTQMIEKNKKVYLITNNVIYVFDIYGAFYTKIHFPHQGELSINNEIIYAYTPQQIIAYNTVTFESETIKFSTKKGDKLKIKNGFLYLLSDNQFTVFSFL